MNSKSIIVWMVILLCVTSLKAQGDPQISGMTFSESPIEINTTTMLTVTATNADFVHSQTIDPSSSLEGYCITVDLAATKTYSYFPQNETAATVESGPNFTFTYSQVGPDMVDRITACLAEPQAPGQTSQLLFTIKADVVSDAKVSVANIDLSDDPSTAGTDDPTNNSQQSALAVTAATPVELVSFTATKQAKQSLLSWQTAIEINNDYFEVERSVNGYQFTPIGQVKGMGTTSEKQAYTFLDRNPVSGVNYYRLKQVDFDDKTEFSPIRSLRFGNGTDSGDIQFYPIPVRGNLNIAGPTDLAGHSILIHDINGKLLKDQAYISGMTLDLSPYKAGIYVVQVLDAAMSVVDIKRIVKM